MTTKKRKRTQTVKREEFLTGRLRHIPLPSCVKKYRDQINVWCFNRYFNRHEKHENDIKFEYEKQKL